jgi:hypothetical protein
MSLISFLTAFVSLALLIATSASTPEVVSPAECTTVPLRPADLIAIVAASPIASPIADEEPIVGIQADLQTIDEITTTIRRSVACTNANDPMRGYALFTPRYLQDRFGGDNQDDLGHLIAALSRAPAVAKPEDRLTLVAITNVKLLDSETAAASVETENANGHFVDEVILIRAGNVWLIDRVILGGASSIGTPVS